MSKIRRLMLSWSATIPMEERATHAMQGRHVTCTTTGLAGRSRPCDVQRCRVDQPTRIRSGILVLCLFFSELLLLSPANVTGQGFGSFLGPVGGQYRLDAPAVAKKSSAHTAPSPISVSPVR